MRTEFVGRDGEFGVAAECLAAALAGRPRVVLCRGEPGIGKTRLAEEIATLAAAAGVPVVWGRGVDADGAPPYWPWRQVLRAAAREVDLARLTAEHGLAGDLRRLVPEVVGNASAEDGSAEDRFRLFDAVARLLDAITRERALVVVLDDAHWADGSSLQLLHHVARALSGERLLLVVNHRDTEPPHPVLMTELPREPVTREVRLRGLDVPAVGRQLSALVGHAVADAEAVRVHARTGGNPFFVAEIGHARPGGGVPATVREAIGARLARLPPAARDVLRAAAVVGREFRARVVAVVSATSEPGCLAALAETTAFGLVEPAAAPGEHRFVHDLIRDAVEAGLGVEERVRLHRAAADALVELHGRDFTPHLSDLARHWAVAAVAGERAHAAAWVERAADDARRRLAHEDAARLYRLALDVGAGEVDDFARCRLLVAVADALHRAGLLAGRIEACTDAAVIARRLDRPDLLAEAVLTVEGGELDVAPERAVRRLGEEALAALGPEPTAVRARLAANLADRCMYLGEYTAAERAAAEALDAARRCGDPVALGAALRARQLVRSGPDGIDERAQLADELLDLGERHDNADARMRARLWRIDVAFQRGELAAVTRELEPVARCVEELRTPTARWHLLQCRAVLAQAQGRFADARRLADQAVEVLPPYGGAWSSALINRLALIGTMTLQTGESPDPGVLPPADGADPTETPFDAEDVIFPTAAAAILAGAGGDHIAQARAVWGRLSPPGSWRPRPHVRSVCYGLGILAAAALDATADVVALRALLAPYRDHHLSSGAGAVAYNGPATLYLGVAARHLGQLDDAVDDLEAADRACTAAGAAGFAVEARCELAAALAARARPGDVARARALAADAAAQATELGMRPYREQAGALVTRIDDERDAPLTPREREVAALVAQGLTNREIATRLFLSERTAQNHVQHILTKLGLRNRGQIAVRFADVSRPAE